jgi:aminomethyltransferase
MRLNQTLKHTPLHEEHVRLGARMVPFAGYDMPVQYPTGVLTEHNWTRAHAGLFDVSHMGQCTLFARDFEAAANALERLIPADVKGLAVNQQRYSQLLNEGGGIIDDLMFTRMPGGEIDLVVNAGRKDVDYQHMARNLPSDCELKPWDMLALIALQGPEAEVVLSAHSPDLAALKFMQAVETHIAGIGVQVSRSGYSGEDGFEISAADENASALWNLLLSDARVRPIGLGARDSLRLEAGLCLYGHDIDETTSPNEAALMWSVAKRRRQEGGFIGASRVQHELRDGVKRLRVGIKPEGKAPAREGTIIENAAGRQIGKITSGGFGPTVNGPVAMGYVESDHAKEGTPVLLLVRDKALPAHVVKLPFVPNRFKR